VKSTVSQALVFNSQMSPEVQDYINARMPIWTTIKGPYTGNTWWTTTIGSSTPTAFFTANVLAPVKLLIATREAAHPDPRVAFHVVTNYKLAGITNNAWLKNLDVGGAFRWEDKASIVTMVRPRCGWHRPQSRPEPPHLGQIRYYIDLSAGYNLRLFNSKVRARIQFNVRNIFEDGHSSGRVQSRRFAVCLPHHRSAAVHPLGQLRSVNEGGIKGTVHLLPAKTASPFFSCGRRKKAGVHEKGPDQCGRFLRE